MSDGVMVSSCLGHPASEHKEVAPQNLSFSTLQGLRPWAGQTAKYYKTVSKASVEKKT